MSKPPPFEEKDKCNGCGTKFGLTNRRHHCRNCGKSYCSKCSSKKCPLPHYGFTEPERVCDACFLQIQNSQKAPAKSSAPATKAATQPSSQEGQVSSPAQRQQQQQAAQAKPAAAKQNLFPDDDGPKQTEGSSAPVQAAPTKKVKNCTCGMPLCICPADKEEETKNEAADVKKPAPAEKKQAVASKPQPTSSSAPSTFSGFGGSSAAKYDFKGDLNEQSRDAIKNGDFTGLQKLIQAGADSKYTDRTGNTLVHLAALFNHENMVNYLVKQGADVWVKNPSGETAVDVAPPALSNKMKDFPKRS